LQAKHYAGSTHAALKSEIKRERSSIDRLAPTRYVLATSRALTPTQKKELAALIGPPLQNEDDIIRAEDLNGLIRKYPDIEKSHIKLWLSGVDVLERVVRSAAHTINKITREEIEAKVRVYAPNPSSNGARDTLEAHHLVIISGPPGAGKTTLAEMLSCAYIAESLCRSRSLDDDFAAIEDSKKQVFFFDDFLGKVALNRNALSYKDSDLARSIKRVRKSPNARFILTTLAYILKRRGSFANIWRTSVGQIRERRGLRLEVRRSTRGTTGVRHASTTTATRAILMGKKLVGRQTA